MMPNGAPPYDERDWTTWRAVMTEQNRTLHDKVDRVLAWADKHEQGEFNFHGRIEGHLASSVVQRDSINQRLIELEIEQKQIVSNLDKVKTRVLLAAGGIGVILPVLAFLAIQLFFHITNHAR